jgi:hypothetical protein
MVIAMAAATTAVAAEMAITVGCNVDNGGDSGINFKEDSIK